jgi:Xaa-Pro aminopeptidase
MITIKSDREIALMREAGNIAMLAHEEIRKAMKKLDKKKLQH